MPYLSFGEIIGETEADALTAEERGQLAELTDVFNYHAGKNQVKEKYYEGHISLRDVNIGIALPQGISNLEVGCSWGQKAVDVLAARSMFDGFVGRNGDVSPAMLEITENNRLLAEYAKACRDELKYGCVFATLSADPVLKCRVRFHSPDSAAALWNGEKGRIDCGLAIIDTAPDEKEKDTWRPSIVYFYTDNYVIVLNRSGSQWIARRQANKMGRPLMEPMIWNATTNKPFGRSRLKRPIRALIDDYVRIMANATIALEFDTTPQKYMLGISEDQYQEAVSKKFQMYVGSMIMATNDPATGTAPSFGQLSQGSLSPHVEKMRMTATQFSAATGLTVADVGIINEANPTSADAIQAQSQTLVLLAQQLNTGNGDALRVIAWMAQAIAGNKRIEDLTEDERNVIAHFKNPAMPSVSVTADAAIKTASARSEFASTDTFLEMIGFDQASIRRIKAQEQRVRGQAVLLEIDDDDNARNVE